MNGDSKADIIWETNTGQASMWLIDGFGMTSATNIGGAQGPSWSVMT